jgi:MFS family permease
VFGSWPPRIPAVKQDLGLGDGELGLALTGMAAGLLLGTRLAGWPVDRFGSRPTMRVGVAVLCVTLVAPALAWSLPSLAAALFLLGLAGGFVDVAMNAQAVAVERAYRRPILSGLHGLWSAGLFVGAVAAGLAAAVGASPTKHFAVVALVLLAGSAIALRGLLAREAEVVPREGAGGGLWSSVVLVLGIIGFSSFLGEGAAADWSAVYLRQDLDASAAAATAGFAAFALAMASCRFVADRLVERFGPVAVVRTGALVAACGLGLGLAVNEPVAVILGWALLGAGLGPVVPVVFSAAGNTGLGATGAVLGRVVTISYLGSIVGPAVIGAAAEAVGLRAALTLPVVLTLLIVGLAGRVEAAAGGRVGTPTQPY